MVYLLLHEIKLGRIIKRIKIADTNPILLVFSTLKLMYFFI